MLIWNDINKEEFIKRLKSNDEDAFAELYLVLIKDLTSFLVKQFKNVKLSDVDAEEIADDAMIKVSNSISDFNQKKGAKLTTWIFDIAINKVKDFLRTRKSDKALAIHTYLEQEFEIKAEAERFQINNPNMVLLATVDTSSIKGSEENIIIRKAFDSLKEPDQDIIRMRRVMEYEDIAKVENKTVNALSTQYARALDRFEKNLRLFNEDHKNEQ